MTENNQPAADPSTRTLNHVTFAELWREGPGKNFAFRGLGLSTACHWKEGYGWTTGPEAVAAALRTMGEVMRNAVPARDAPAWLRKAHIAGALSLANALPDMLALPEQWDRDPLLAGLPDGSVVDLRFSDIREPTREEYVSKRLGAVPNRDASMDRFWGVLKLITGDRDGYRRALRAVMGSAILGHAERAFPIALGPSGTGKTVFAETLMALAGDYATAMRGETLSAGRGEHPTAIAMLEGKRLVVASELKGGVWRSEFVKRLTGGDTLSAHAMRQDERSFRPSHILLAIANPGDLPQTAILDDAMVARVRILPFDNPPEHETPHLAQQIAANELPAIVSFALEGAKDVAINGLLHILDQCPTILDATADWQNETDSIGDWIRDRCQTGAGLWQERQKLLDSYQSFAGQYAAGKLAFYSAMRERYGQETTRKGKRGFVGIRDDWA